MRLQLHHPEREGSGFGLTLDYHVPAGGKPCMALFCESGTAQSLYMLFQIDGEAFSMPSTLTLEEGDRILLYGNRELIVKEELSLLVPIKRHEFFLFHLACHFISGSFLKRQDEDREFFAAFNRIFALKRELPFTLQEIKEYVIKEQTFGNDIEDYFNLPPATRQTFLDAVGLHQIA